MKLQAPKGCRDIYGSEIEAVRYLEQSFSSLAEAYGFSEIRVPTFESTDLFARGVGDATDIVSKEMYTFMDKGGRSLTLRPEVTAGVVRAYLEHGMAALPSPVKFYYMLNNFRYERPQKGRYREFQQFGMELFGAGEPSAEAEILSFLASFFVRLGLTDYELLINSIGCPSCRTEYHDQLRQFLQAHADQLCSDCRERMERNPLRCLDCKQDKCCQIMTEAPVPRDHLCPECADHYQGVKDLITALGINYREDPRLVRGLDYYTKTVFEFHAKGIGAQSAICGGGRYDGLVKQLGGPDTPGLGFAFGVERLRLELEARGIELPGQRQADLQIISFPETRAQSLDLAAALRQQGLYIETDIMGRSFKAQMKQANRMGAKFIIVLGEDELGADSLCLRSLADGQEFEVNRLELAEFLLAKKK